MKLPEVDFIFLMPDPRNWRTLILLAYRAQFLADPVLLPSFTLFITLLQGAVVLRRGIYKARYHSLLLRLKGLIS